MRHLAVAVVATVVACLFASALACTHERVVDPFKPQHPRPGDGDPISRDVSGGTAPGGMVHGLDGKDLELASLWEKQRVVIVFYMGHWCPHCQKQLGELNEHVKDLADRNATLIAISTDTVDDATALKTRLSLAFDLFSDPDLTTIAKWGVADYGAGISKPATFIVEPGGNIRFRHVGATQTDRPSVQDILAALEDNEPAPSQP